MNLNAAKIQQSLPLHDKKNHSDNKLSNLEKFEALEADQTNFGGKKRENFQLSKNIKKAVTGLLLVSTILILMMVFAQSEASPLKIASNHLKTVKLVSKSVKAKKQLKPKQKNSKNLKKHWTELHKIRIKTGHGNTIPFYTTLVKREDNVDIDTDVEISPGDIFELVQGNRKVAVEVAGPTDLEGITLYPEAFVVERGNLQICHLGISFADIGCNTKRSLNCGDISFYFEDENSHTLPSLVSLNVVVNVDTCELFGKAYLEY